VDPAIAALERPEADVFRRDAVFYAEKCILIIDDEGNRVALKAKPAQKRLQRALDEQDRAGQPMRAIILKARKLGFSTWVQALLLQRCTLHANHRALVVAHDLDTASELFDIADFANANLPKEPDLAFLRPPFDARQRSIGQKFIRWAERSREQQALGNLGLNSSLRVDTAKDIEGGRGFTYRSVHCSEVAFWPQEGKLTAVTNAVPNRRGTLIALESTANGTNFFKTLWDEAVDGNSGYAPIFAPWHEERSYRLKFPTPVDRQRFAEQVGKGTYGKDEPELMREYGCDLEQLAWRRRIIVAQCERSVDKFKQEYPASAEEAFLRSGRTVFSVDLIGLLINRVHATDAQRAVRRFRRIGRAAGEATDPERGVLVPAVVSTERGARGLLEVPQGAMWVDAVATGFPEDYDGWWHRWEEPVTVATELVRPPDEKRKPRQYVIAADVAAGEANTKGERARHAVQVIDWLTGRQVAEYASRIDPDLLAEQVLLAALHYGDGMPVFAMPMVAVEVTGGWGLPAARRLELDYLYPRLYYRRDLKKQNEDESEVLGWDTGVTTKPMLNALGNELLRGGADGIQSAELAHEMTTYIRLPNGKTEPEEGAFNDRVMAWLIAHQVRQIEEPAVLSTPGNLSSSTRTIQSRRTGY
jgi:hypothetical protein